MRPVERPCLPAGLAQAAAEAEQRKAAAIDRLIRRTGSAPARERQDHDRTEGSK